MSEQIKIQKTIYNLRDFNTTVNTDFSELAPPIAPINGVATPDITIPQFFEQYDILYFDIPVSGSENSHLELASKSLDRVGISLEDLQAEIDYLRQENIELKNQVLQISGLNPNDVEEI